MQLDTILSLTQIYHVPKVVLRTPRSPKAWAEMDFLWFYITCLVLQSLPCFQFYNWQITPLPSPLLNWFLVGSAKSLTFKASNLKPYWAIKTVGIFWSSEKAPTTKRYDDKGIVLRVYCIVHKRYDGKGIVLGVYCAIKVRQGFKC